MRWIACCDLCTINARRVWARVRACVLPHTLYMRVCVCAAVDWGHCSSVIVLHKIWRQPNKNILRCPKFWWSDQRIANVGVHLKLRLFHSKSHPHTHSIQNPFYLLSFRWSVSRTTKPATNKNYLRNSTHVSKYLLMQCTLPGSTDGLCVTLERISSLSIGIFKFDHSSDWDVKLRVLQRKFIHRICSRSLSIPALQTHTHTIQTETHGVAHGHITHMHITYTKSIRCTLIETQESHTTQTLIKSKIQDDD